MPDERVSGTFQEAGGVSAPLASGEKVSLDLTIGDGSMNSPNAATSETVQMFRDWHFKAKSITYLADTNNSGTIFIGGRSKATFPLTNGVAESDRNVLLDTIGFRGTSKGDILHVTFVAE